MPHRIMVQAGHWPPLQPGHEGQTGAIGERDLVRKIQLALAALLDGDSRFKSVPVPGRIPSGARVDAALFLHADGSSNPSASGFSFGYPNYPVNRSLAQLLASEFQRIPGHPIHRGDNYTRDESQYYGFYHVDTQGPEVLVEHGFTSNPGERAWLNANVDALAQAEYRALCRFFGYEVDGGGGQAGAGVRAVAAHGPAAAGRAATKSEARLRKGPDQTTPGLGIIVRNTNVAVTGSNGDWRRVVVGGWIHKSLLNEAARQGGGAQGQTAGTHGTGATATGAVTLETPLMGGPRAAVEQAQGHMLSNAHGGYSDDDVKHIVQLYFDTAGRVGLDPLLVVVQMAHETGNLSSFWSQEPRRNPAGIGVTGAAGEGLSFPDWTTAVRAHVGRLLAYVLRPGAENPTQSQLIAQALTFRALPPTHRGTVRTLGDLGGGVWAEDPEYAAKLVRLANNFRGHAA